jgi:hypothetical protein
MGLAVDQRGQELFILRKRRLCKRSYTDRCCCNGQSQSKHFVPPYVPADSPDLNASPSFFFSSMRPAAPPCAPGTQLDLTLSLQ